MREREWEVSLCCSTATQQVMRMYTYEKKTVWMTEPRAPLEISSLQIDTHSRKSSKNNLHVPLSCLYHWILQCATFFSFFRVSLSVSLIQCVFALNFHFLAVYVRIMLTFTWIMKKANRWDKKRAERRWEMEEKGEYFSDNVPFYP